ncbi:MAG: sensor histidine kinase, partial [Acidimicrobiia bacterium]
LRSEVLSLVHDVADRSELRAHLDFDGAIDAGVPSDVAPDLLAVLREALSNTVRHANARKVDVRLSTTDGIELRVTDDGVGLPEDLERRSGLANLAQRAEAYGGTFRIESRPGGGTTIIWRVPADSGG